jgi:hypothetical protein
VEKVAVRLHHNIIIMAIADAQHVAGHAIA